MTAIPGRVERLCRRIATREGLLVTVMGMLAINVLNPFFFDHHIYHANAFQLVRFGKLPYVGTWDQNFPGIVYVHALAISVFGPHELGFRVVDTVSRLTLVLLTFHFIRPWLGDRVAWLAGFFVAWFYLLGFATMAGQRDSFACLGIAIALMTLRSDHGAKQRTQVGVALIAGLGAGWACSIRPTYSLFAIVLGVIAAQRWKRITPVASYFAALLLPLLVMLLPYITIPGGLREFYLATVQFNLDLYSRTEFRYPIAKALIKPSEVILNVALLFGFVAWRLDRSQRINRSELFAFLSVYLSLRIPIYLMGKYFVCHYEPVFFMSAIILGYAFKQFADRLNLLRARVLLIPALLLVAVAVVYPWRFANELIYGLVSRGPFAFERAQATVRGESLEEFLKPRRIAEYVDGAAQTGIEILAVNPEINWRCELPMASRYTMIFPLGMKLPSGEYTGYQQSWRQAYCDTLVASSPKFLILDNAPERFRGPDNADFLEASPKAIALGIPRFQEMLTESYHLETVIGTCELWSRNR